MDTHRNLVQTVSTFHSSLSGDCGGHFFFKDPLFFQSPTELFCFFFLHLPVFFLTPHQCLYDPSLPLTTSFFLAAIVLISAPSQFCLLDPSMHFLSLLMYAHRGEPETNDSDGAAPESTPQTSGGGARRRIMERRTKTIVESEITLEE